MITKADNVGKCPLTAASGHGAYMYCEGEMCMAWRTVDGDPAFGFCGMAPVLPYPLRGGNVGQAWTTSPEINGQPARENS